MNTLKAIVKFILILLFWWVFIAFWFGANLTKSGFGKNKEAEARKKRQEYNHEYYMKHRHNR